MRNDGVATASPNRTAKHRRVMEHIRLLCHCGAGLEAVAGPLCHAVRDVIDAASSAVFWVDAAGTPAGFFHDCAPPELKDLFVTRFDELFGAPDQITMLNFIGEGGAPIGKTLADGFLARWLRGNIHLHLCRPLGHHHMLDMRIDRDGKGCAAFFAWNPEGRPFSLRDVASWAPVRLWIEQAAKADPGEVLWRTVDDAHGHFITDPSGTALIAIHPAAESVLKDGHLLKQNIGMTGRLDEAPSFAQLLATALERKESATIHLPVANGRLVARASRTRIVGSVSPDAAMMHVSLHREVARNMLAVEYLMALSLTPFQREIALYAMTGGARAECGIELGVSDEALKKHLRAIFAATGTTRWADLAAVEPPTA